jgi:hypothetical protein
LSTATSTASFPVATDPLTGARCTISNLGAPADGPTWRTWPCSVQHTTTWSTKAAGTYAARTQLGLQPLATAPFCRRSINARAAPLNRGRSRNGAPRWVHEWFNVREVLKETTGMARGWHCKAADDEETNLACGAAPNGPLEACPISSGQPRIRHPTLEPASAVQQPASSTALKCGAGIDTPRLEGHGCDLLCSHRSSLAQQPPRPSEPPRLAECRSSQRLTPRIDVSGQSVWSGSIGSRRSLRNHLHLGVVAGQTGPVEPPDPKVPLTSRLGTARRTLGTQQVRSLF